MLLHLLKFLSDLRAPTCVTAVALISLMVVSPMAAQTTLSGQMVIRPMTMDDIAQYNLPATTERSGGLTTVGVGAAVNLEADIDIAVPASQIAGVSWELTSKPANSNAQLTGSALGSNVPISEPSDRLAFQIAGRTLLRPDVPGVYNVKATVTTVGSGVATFTMMITASDFLGIQACSSCHGSGPASTIWSMVTPWSKTLHAEIFKDGITGVNGTSYSVSCIGCHTVGYDTDPNAVNGGFDDVAAQLHWTMPTTLQPSNWTNLPAALQNLANIQCENCHGPGSTHVATGGDPRLISTSFGSGACTQCHADATHHIKGEEWNNSVHAITTRDPAGTQACVGCHTATGFTDRMNGVTITNTAYTPITCQACHEPHGITNPSSAAHQLRSLVPVTLQDGTKVTNGGLGTLCMNCHQARVNAASYVPTTPGSAHYGPHHGPQTDMLEGVNGYNYGKSIPSSAHGEVVPDTCVTCHMQTVATTDAAIGQVGGHTMKLKWPGNGTNPAEDLVAACQGCHGPELTSINFPLFDYNQDGVIEGAQTEVQHILDKLAMMLPPVGQAKSTITVDATWTQPQLNAAYNYLFVQSDGSLGIHNMAYTVGLLNASIADLQNSAKK